MLLLRNTQRVLEQKMYVGKNMCPTDASAWEQGTINGTTGINQSSATTLRTISYWGIKESTVIKTSASSGYSIQSVFFYREDYSYISDSLTSVPALAKYFRVRLIKDGSVLTPSLIPFIKPQLELGSTATPYSPYSPSALNANSLIDRSRYANNGVFSNVTWVQLPTGVWVMSLASVSSKVTVAKRGSINNLTQSTFRCVIYYGGGASGSTTLFNKGDIKFFYIDQFSNRAGFSQWFNSTYGSWYATAHTFTPGKWYTLQITYDNTSTANSPVILVNGVSIALSVGLTGSGAAYPDQDYDLLLGHSVSETENFNGYLADILMLNRIATVAEGKRWHNSVCVKYGLAQIP